MRKSILFLCFYFVLLKTNGQTLFSYGSHHVDADEFLYSFRKNNTDSSSKEKSVNAYLDLFIKFKLKVQAAHDAKLDTLSNLKNELIAYRNQIAPMHLLDKRALDSLAKQAMARSKEEIEVQYIFIAFNKNRLSEKNTTPTNEEIQSANARALNINARIAKGEDFGQLANSFSDDTITKKTNGYLGFISCFSLPYEFENVIYNLKDGEVSNKINAEDGIYFFKRMRSRKSIGKINAQHILIATPENPNKDEVKIKKSLADSLLVLLNAGFSFDSLARKYSDDRSSNTKGGIIQDAELGTYDPIFENQLRDLKRDGELSPVFQTDYGFHILKRHSVAFEPNESENRLNEFKDQIINNDRKLIPQKIFEEKAIAWAKGKNINTNQKNFIKDHLEEIDQDFRLQINDFKEGNLLFEIMDRKVWSKATQDVAGMKNFHDSRKNQYKWSNSVYAWIITGPSRETIDKIISQYKINKSLQSIKHNYSDVVLIDSGRFEASELVNVGNQHATSGFISEPYVNQMDGSVTFVIVVKKYSDPTVKTFDEAKGNVTNDFQQFIENNWIESLKKKYPVTIDKKVLSNLINSIN